jgi:hypothetical protein
MNFLGKKECAKGLFTGEYVRTEADHSYLSIRKKFLLKSIKDKSSQIVADFQWFHMVTGFYKADLQPGDIVEFSGKVIKNVTGRKKLWDGSDGFGLKGDFKIIFPAKIKKLEGVTEHKK